MNRLCFWTMAIAGLLLIIAGLIYGLATDSGERVGGMF